MYKILLPFCIMGCVSTHVFAEDTLLSILDHKHSNIQKAQDTINKNNNINYTDFSMLDLVYVYSDHGTAKEMHKDIGKVTITLNNGDLVVESNTHSSDASEDGHLKCVYKKQQ